MFYLVFKAIKCHWRLVTLSPVAKQLNTQVLWTELGVANIDNLKGHFECFTPPIVNQISLTGINPLCQLCLPVLQSYSNRQFTVPDAAIHSWRHLAHTVHHTAVPVAVRGCWSTLHTSAPLASTGCSRLPKVD